ncbi:MAG: DoxX family protein [Bacteroidetes bacterium]|nr:DoxX family protein [Bacteroidota bacterium]
MLKPKTWYWILTVLFAGMMLFSSVPNILQEEEAVQFITHLGYPVYFIVFIGIAKTLGAIAILLPGFPRIKEWAYAGLIFDLVAAVYSMIAVEGFQPQMSFMILPFGLAIGSYVLYHKTSARGK